MAGHRHQFGAGLVSDVPDSAHASVPTQQISVQPRKRLTMKIEPEFTSLLSSAMIAHRKWRNRSMARKIERAG